MTLYQLSNDYIDALRRLEDAGDDPERAEALAALDAIDGDLTQKAEAYAKAMLNLRAEAEAAMTESMRLAERERRLKNSVEALKARMLDAMQRLDIRRIDTPIGRWRLQLNPPACKVLDPDRVPAEFRVPQPDRIDSRAILKNYRETGEIIDGVDIRRELGIRFA